MSLKKFSELPDLNVESGSQNLKDVRLVATYNGTNYNVKGSAFTDYIGEATQSAQESASAAATSEANAASSEDIALTAADIAVRAAEGAATAANNIVDRINNLREVRVLVDNDLTSLKELGIYKAHAVHTTSGTDSDLDLSHVAIDPGATVELRLFIDSGYTGTITLPDACWGDYVYDKSAPGAAPTLDSGRMYSISLRNYGEGFVIAHVAHIVIGAVFGD